MDITTIYNYLQHKQCGRKVSRDTKSLATICAEVLSISLSKVWFFNTKVIVQYKSNALLFCFLHITF